MDFIALIRKNNWLNIKAEFLHHYPDQKDSLDGYHKVYQSLLSLTPEESDMVIVIKHIVDDYDGEEYEDVSGILPNDKNSYGLGFRPWSRWLGMKIHHRTLQEYSTSEIIAHCLFEMTFYGFEQESIQSEIKKLKDISDEYDSWTDEEKAANTISMEELLKKWEEEE